MSKECTLFLAGFCIAWTLFPAAVALVFLITTGSPDYHVVGGR